MARSPTALVEPELLVWARTKAGYDLATAATKAKVNKEKLQAWEGGTGGPSIAQLRKLGTVYKRPLAVFFLAEPPKGWDAMRDYRRFPDHDDIEQSPELRLAIREAWERRDAAAELAIDLDIAPEPFPLNLSLDRDPEAAGERLRESLGVTAAAQASCAGNREAFNLWREAIEALDVLVFGFPSVDLAEARGFSITTEPYPVVAVNNADAYAGRLFTLLHECTHIALNSESALCDLATGAHVPDVEVFCNHVAAAALVPKSELLRLPGVSSARSTSKWSDDSLADFSRRFRVSREVILRRLLTCGRMSLAFYQSKRRQFQREYLSTKKESSGGQYLYNVISQNGRAYMRLVLAAHGQNAISLSEASGLLGVRAKHVATLERDPQYGFSFRASMR